MSNRSPYRSRGNSSGRMTPAVAMFSLFLISSTMKAMFASLGTDRSGMGHVLSRLFLKKGFRPPAGLLRKSRNGTQHRARGSEQVQLLRTPVFRRRIVRLDAGGHVVFDAVDERADRIDVQFAGGTGRKERQQFPRIGDGPVEPD